MMQCKWNECNAWGGIKIVTQPVIHIYRANANRQNPQGSRQTVYRILTLPPAHGQRYRNISTLPPACGQRYHNISTLPPTCGQGVLKAFHLHLATCSWSRGFKRYFISILPPARGQGVLKVSFSTKNQISGGTNAIRK